MQPPRIRPRPGFTVVEQLVALVVLGTGLLVVAQGVVAMQRNASRAARRLDAVNAASSALERLTAAGCAAAGSGGSSTGMVDVRWASAGDAPAVTLTASARAHAGGTILVDSLASARDCRPGT